MFDAKPGLFKEIIQRMSLLNINCCFDLPCPFQYKNMLSRRLETSLGNDCVEIFMPVFH